MLVRYFDTVDAVDAFTLALPLTGFHLSSAVMSAHLGKSASIAAFLPGSRAYAVALAVVEGARGVQSPPPGFFVAAFDSQVEAVSVEAAFQAVDPAVWAAFIEYAGNEFTLTSGVDYASYTGPLDYAGWCASRGLPVFTGAPEYYLESLGETFLGD